MMLSIDGNPEKKNIQYNDIVGERVLFLQYHKKQEEKEATDIQDVETK